MRGRLRSWRFGAFASVALLGSLLFISPASADTFPWSAKKNCVVAFGSDKQVKVQWRVYRTATGETRVKPHQIVWSTFSPGIPLYPIDYFVIGLGSTPHSIVTEDVTDGASGSWLLTEASYKGVPAANHPYVVIDAHLSNSTRICSVTLTYP